MERRASLLCVFVLSIAESAAASATRPLTETLPINATATVQVTIEVASGALKAKIAKEADIKTRCVAAKPQAPAIAFTNASDGPLRITLRSPKSCKPSCSLDLDQYRGICEPSETPGQCTPVGATLAICGSRECEAIRKACSGPNCIVDFYRAVEECGCSVTKTVGKGQPVLFESALFLGDKGEVVKDPFTFIVERDTSPSQQPWPAPTILTWSFTKDSVPGCIAPDPAGLPMKVVVIPLDDTGVASWRYTNPRSPACIKCKPNDVSAGVAFRNRTFDRTFAVSITLPATARLPPAYLATFKCKDGKACTVSRAVGPQTAILFDSSLLSAFTGALIQFDVTLLGEATQLSNAHAYLTLEPTIGEGSTPIGEPPSTTTIKTAVGLSANIDPALPIVPAKLTDDPNFKPCKAIATYDPKIEPLLCDPVDADHPGRQYNGGNTQQYKASGSVRFSPNLGNRADGAVQFSFRSGTVGSTIDKVALDEYFVSIYGTNALSLRLGKTKFAVPTSGIALSESGEGFLYSFHQWSLGHIVSRESATGVADQPNRDKKEWFLQARSLSLGQRWRDKETKEEIARAANQTPKNGSLNPFEKFLTFFRTLDLIAMRGRDKAANYRYWTTGGELFFARPGKPGSSGKEGTTAIRDVIGGSIALYRSSRQFRGSAPCLTAGPATCASAMGTNGLLNLNWTPEIDINTANLTTTTTPHAFGITFGMGSRDASEALNTPFIRGYIGEKPVLPFDKVFYATIVPSLNSADRAYVTPALLNKQFVALRYTNNEYSIFDVFASLLDVNSDVNSRTTSIVLTESRLREPRNGSRGGGREADVNFKIEVPKGITFSLDTGYMQPGDAYSDIVKKPAWMLAIGVSLSL